MKIREAALNQIKQSAEISSVVGKAFMGHPDQIARHRLISCNHIARTVAYRLNEIEDSDILFIDNDRIIDVIDEDCMIRQYNAKKIKVNDKGLVCYILQPNSVASDNNNARIHLVFRGTKDSYAWQRNIQDPTPGSQAINDNKQTILTELLSAITLEQTHIIISGHSLGGADAQNFLAFLMDQINAAKDSSRSKDSLIMPHAVNKRLLNIIELTLNASNPAGISELVAFYAKRDSAYLAKNGLKINAMYILAAGDIVPQSGHAHIFADIINDEVSVCLAKFSDMFSDYYLSGKNLGLAGLGGGVSGFLTPFYCAALVGLGAFATFRAHKSKISIEELLEGKFDLYSNSTKEGRDIISDKLGKHSLDNSFIYVSQEMLNSFMYSSKSSRSNSSSPTSVLTPSPEEVTEEDTWIFVPDFNAPKLKAE